MNQQELLAMDEHRKALQRARAKKFYEKHRRQILLQRKVQRDNFRQLINTIRPPRIVPQIPNPIQNLDQIKDFTQQELIQLIKSKQMKIGSEKIYLDNVDRLFDAIQIDSFYEAIKNPTQIINNIESLRSNRNTLYSLNSKKAIYQAIVYIFSNFMNLNDPVVKNAQNILRKKFREYQYNSKVDNLSKTTDEKYSIPSFDQYLDKCKRIFGQDSKQYLISLLYSLCTVRDDFKNLILIANEEQNDGKQNYLFHNNEQSTFYINIFKTKNNENPIIK